MPVKQKPQFFLKSKNGTIRGVTTKNTLKEHGVENVGDFYLDSILNGFENLTLSHDDVLKDTASKIRVDENFPIGFRPHNEVWRYEPVTNKYFCQRFLGFNPTEKQLEAIDVVCGVDPFDFTNMKYEEVDLMWGKRSGKDSIIAITCVIQCYRLCCLVNPQEFLGLGVGSSIDVVNVASNSDQAKKAFFTYLKNYVRITKDPSTGLNWFASRNFWYDVGTQDFKYMDLRDKDGGIKQTHVEFGRSVNCHSLTSERFTAEGLNIILAVMDEVGAMKPERVFGDEERLIGQYDSLSATVRATSKYGKMVAISYKYGRNCPMSILIKRNKKDPKKFVRVYSTYDVRTDKGEKVLRAQFASEYAKDPEKAAMMYECKNPKVESDNLYSNIFFLNRAMESGEDAKYSINPVRGKRITIDNIYADMDDLLDAWFKGNPDYYYAVHLDLAKGRVWHKQDAIGLAMGHLQEMRLHFDPLVIKYYKEQFNQDISELQGQLRMGIVVDLLLQITCKPEDGEVNLSDVRRFVINLHEKRQFEIYKVTIDGWQSLETLQEFNRKGFDAELLSVDRDVVCHHTQKDLIQMGLFKTYEHKIWHRETRELLDLGNKIDHPEISVDRFEEEGYDHGSKDVTDASAGMVHTLSTELEEGGGIFYG